MKTGLTFLASALLTGCGAWLTFGADAVTGQELDSRMAQHSQQPHPGATTRAEFEMLRFMLGEILKDVRFLRQQHETNDTNAVGATASPATAGRQ